MNTQERIICRFCLKTCDTFKTIEGDIKDALDMVLREIDLTVTQEPMMCTYCAAMLIKSSHFKTTCLDARDSILPCIKNDGDDQKLDLKQVYLSMNENGIGLSEIQEICGFCMSPVKSCSALSINVEGGDILLLNMIEQCLPELDFSIIKQPVICAPCRDILEDCFCFMTNCLIMEEKINKYRDTQNINGKGQIELSGLLEFMTRDAATKVEREGAVKKEIGNGGEQMLVDVKESVKAEPKLKNESCTEVDNIITTKNMLACEGGIKLLEKFCEKSEFEKETVDTNYQLNEEIEIKPEECDVNRSENDVVYKDPSGMTIYKCPNCLFQTKLISNLKKHLSRHNVPPLDLTLYKCDTCSYQAVDEHSLRKHLLRHKKTTYKCHCCSFETKHLQSFKRHSLMHMDPSKVKMYKCDVCPYEAKVKNDLKLHMVRHKDPSEIPMFKCDICPYQSKRKSNLKSHSLCHKNPSEVTTYKCDDCFYQTVHKSIFKTHLLIHKEKSEVKMYKCEPCLFETRYKITFENHLRTHKDPSKVTTYKCNLCTYRTVLKGSLRSHMLTHKDPSEVTMHKCSLCSYQAKVKCALTRHMQNHTDPSEVIKYK